MASADRMRRISRRRWPRISRAGWRLARPQHHGDRPRGGVVDMDRQEAALVVVRIEQRQLLVAVHHIDGVVDVERDCASADRRWPWHQRSIIA